MNISFILLTWDSENYINKCLASIFTDLPNSNYTYEIFLIDNGSKDNTVPIIKSFKNKYPDHIIPIYLEKNYGTTYSRNLALKKQKAEKPQKRFIHDFRFQ
ncbi:MAG: glycosyltransferase [Proteobacteria bacterium]|nr:glycosyltransferase [Pseudomonadota bacterium]MBU4286578.1 glycosyltransferase [Pseudomonadota bacterium]MCG2758644.1 glycosyltransferase [Desulfobacteraceae bacterium]MCG2821355.1 glycosyltransferase [Candidatus Atribacteria bacterium]